MHTPRRLCLLATLLLLGGTQLHAGVTHLAGDLGAPGGVLTGFTIAGTDGVFHPATAVIAGETVRVSTCAVPQPTSVRHAWANVAHGNLCNPAGLPASPFRTDAK